MPNVARNSRHDQCIITAPPAGGSSIRKCEKNMDGGLKMMKCRFCGATLTAWWPSADTGAYVCRNKECTDPEFVRGNGRELQYPKDEDVEE